MRMSCQNGHTASVFFDLVRLAAQSFLFFFFNDTATTEIYTLSLHDALPIYNQDTGEGTGFLFDQLTPRAVYDTVGWAVWAYYNKKEDLKKMQKRGMEKKFGWDIAAENYLEVYKEALKRGCNK